MTDCNVLALLPFLVRGALPIEIFRAMPSKGIDVTVAFCMDTSPLYSADPMEDFAARDRLIDLSGADMDESFAAIAGALEERTIQLVVQVGATPLYPNLPRWKEGVPQLRIADILFNEYAHTLNHVLYEPSIDGVIVESEAMKRYVERASSKEQPLIELVHSGVDLEWFSPPDRPPTESAGITVGYVGRMSAEKNPIGFVDLAERLLSLDPDLEFRMAGGGPGAAQVEERLTRSPHSHRIHYAGFVEDLRSALHAIDVLILPSKFDGRPVIVMEANACGIPVVAAPVGGVPELIEEGVNGYLLRPEETAAIHDLLSSWTSSPAALAALKRSSRDYACRMFDRNKMIDDYALAFRRIASPSDATLAAAR
jgi:glycosyltransferase involved in cell wall biosynthesis